jgi:uncharacterized protein YndB with AHSA1/START domain
MTAAQQLPNAGIRATADAEMGTIHVVADIAASPEVVFRALTDPEELAKWWGAEGVYRTERWEVDLRPGGKWVTHIAAPEGAEMGPRDEPEQEVRGEYIQVDPPRLLEFTWSPSWDGFRVTTVKYEIEQTATGSRLTVLHSGFAGRPEMATAHSEGWVRVLGWFSSYISRR